MNPAFEYTYDVVVCGAGTAGATAALAAADQGAKVLVVEQFGSAGGSGSLGLVTPLMSNGIASKPMCSYISDEINHRLFLEKAGDGDQKSYFDPLMLSLVLEEMLQERGVTMLYHSMVTGVTLNNGHIDHISVSNISGTGIVRARNKFIDCTGDATLCALAGLTTLHGAEDNHKNQPCSLRYVVGGVDTVRFWHFLCEKRGVALTERPENYTMGVTLNNGSKRTSCLDSLFAEAVACGDLTPDDAFYWQFFTLAGRPDSIAFNCPEFFDIDDIANAEAQSYVQVQGKLRILRHIRFYRKYLPGFENACVSSISAMVGIRESRRADTEYVLTTGDAYSWRKFEDAVAQTNYPIDVHGRKLNCEDFERDVNDPKPFYEIPFRSLIVKGADNLLAAGRNLGAEFVAQSSVRIIPTCRALGEAAGIAAAMNTNDGKLVRAEMERRGAHFA